MARSKERTVIDQYKRSYQIYLDIVNQHKHCKSLSVNNNAVYRKLRRCKRKLEKLESSPYLPIPMQQKIQNDIRKVNNDIDSISSVSDIYSSHQPRPNKRSAFKDVSNLKTFRESTKSFPSYPPQEIMKSSISTKRKLRQIDENYNNVDLLNICSSKKCSCVNLENVMDSSTHSRNSYNGQGVHYKNSTKHFFC